MPKLVMVAVERLLDRFDHKIEFPADDPFTIIYGPNGIGKTKLLELIRSVSNGQLDRAATLPFYRATFEFSSGHLLTLTRQERIGPPLAGQELVDTPIDATLIYHGSDDRGSLSADPWKDARFDALSWEVEPESPDVAPGVLRRIEREFAVQRISDDLWEDYETGERFSTRIAVERYAPGSAISPEPVLGPDAERIREFLIDAPALIVETQRLVVARTTGARRARVGRASPSAAEQHAQDLAKRIQAALAENSTASQRRDRTFPKRLLTEPRDPDELTDEAVRSRYAAQTEFRDQLTKFTISDATEAIPLPTRDLVDWERTMLDKYMDDADEKLKTFVPLLEQLNLFTKIVNSRLNFKSLSVDRENGFTFETDRGVPIKPRDLSSGEQHEVVLAYDLIFNVKAGSLVLIDEPEISLHVVWQQAFLDDLASIATITQARFVVATHSPQIIHNWISRAHSLTGNSDV